MPSGPSGGQLHHPLTKVSQIVTQLVVGPLPPHEDLAAYERIQPGLADRIVAMAEKNSTHRHAIETAVVEGNIAAQRRGSWFGLIISLAVMVFAAWLAHLGMGGLAIAAVVFEVTVIASIFIGVRIAQARERAKKKRELAPAAGEHARA